FRCRNKSIARTSFRPSRTRGADRQPSKISPGHFPMQSRPQMNSELSLLLVSFVLWWVVALGPILESLIWVLIRLIRHSDRTLATLQNQLGAGHDLISQQPKSSANI